MFFGWTTGTLATPVRVSLDDWNPHSGLSPQLPCYDSEIVHQIRRRKRTICSCSKDVQFQSAKRTCARLLMMTYCSIRDGTTIDDDILLNTRWHRFRCFANTYVGATRVPLSECIVAVIALSYMCIVLAICIQPGLFHPMK